MPGRNWILSRGLARNALRLRMPTDEVAAQILRDWAATRGLHLIEVGTYSLYPYACGRGHVVESADDEAGTERRCGKCQAASGGRNKKAA